MGSLPHCTVGILLPVTALWVPPTHAMYALQVGAVLEQYDGLRRQVAAYHAAMEAAMQSGPAAAGQQPAVAAGEVAVRATRLR